MTAAQIKDKIDSLQAAWDIVQETTENKSDRAARIRDAVIRARALADRMELLLREESHAPKEPTGEFKCPECGGSYFGTSTICQKDELGSIKRVAILEYQCGDQFRKGCRWAGSTY